MPPPPPTSANAVDPPESSGPRKFVQEKVKKARAATESSRLKETFSDFRNEAVKAASSHGSKVAEKARSFFIDENPERKRETELTDQEPTAPTGFRDFLTTFYLLPNSKKIVLAVGTILLLGVAGIFPSCSSSTSSLPFVGQSASELSLTISEFRKEIRFKQIPKSEFYEKYGKPEKVTTLGGDTYLFYICNDGQCRVKCSATLFQGHHRASGETILAASVDET